MTITYHLIIFTIFIHCSDPFIHFFYNQSYQDNPPFSCSQTIAPTIPQVISNSFSNAQIIWTIWILLVIHLLSKLAPFNEEHHSHIIGNKNNNDKNKNNNNNNNNNNNSKYMQDFTSAAKVSTSYPQQDYEMINRPKPSPSLQTEQGRENNNSKVIPNLTINDIEDDSFHL